MLCAGCGGTQVGRIEVAGDEVGADEVDGGEEPEHHVAVTLLCEGTPVGVDAHEAFYTPCGGNAVADERPKTAHGVARPRESAEEEEHHGSEDNDKHAAFAFGDEGAESYPEERGGHEQREDKQQVVGEMAHVGEMEDLRHEIEHVDADGEIKRYVAEGLAEYGGHGACRHGERIYASVASATFGASGGKHGDA